MAKFWKFAIYNTLSARYSPSTDKKMSKMDIEGIQKAEFLPAKAKWDVNITLQSAQPISMLNSGSHEIDIEYKHEKHVAVIKIKAGTVFNPEKDFTLYYRNEQVNQPMAVVQKTMKEEKQDQIVNVREQFCAMISFFPDFSAQSADDAWKAMQADKVKDYYDVDDIKLGNTKGEYIFLIDRSGSMSGSRMRTANEALVMFLKSMPIDSFFNIVSFGSAHKFMYDKSQAYTEDVVEKTIALVEKFTADFGMTEIH